MNDARAITDESDPPPSPPEQAGVGRGGVRRILIGTAGWTLVATGVALLILPGPGWLIIAAGFAVLATEFEWAKKYLRAIKSKVADFRGKSRPIERYPSVPRGDGVDEASSSKPA